MVSLLGRSLYSQKRALEVRSDPDTGHDLVDDYLRPLIVLWKTDEQAEPEGHNTSSQAHHKQVFPCSPDDNTDADIRE